MPMRHMLLVWLDRWDSEDAVLRLIYMRGGFGFKMMLEGFYGHICGGAIWL